MKISSPAIIHNGKIPRRLTQIAINNNTFKLGKSCREIDDRKWHITKPIQCHLRLPIFSASMRSNMLLFTAIGITCEGDEINPPLCFSDAPKDTKSLVLIMEDPDVPKHLCKNGMWDHWVLFNISPNIQKIEENTTPPFKQGVNTSGHLKYDATCPPDREHRYFFKLLALNSMLNLSTGSSKKDVMNPAKGHFIEETQLIGLYQREHGKLSHA